MTEKIFHILLMTIITLQCIGQGVECYCYEGDASIFLNKGNGADKIVEWIVIKGDSVAVISYMDKSCKQSLSFFEEKYEEERNNDRLYPLVTKEDSIFFTKVFDFDVNGQTMSQKYVYDAKLFGDSLAVHVDYPKSKNTFNSFIDVSGPPNRKYFRVYPKKEF